MPEPKPVWMLYLLRSEAEERTYVGVTIDVERRLQQHNGALPGGAKATRRGRPWSIFRILGTYPNRSEAQQAEAAFKRLNGAERLSAEPKNSL